MGSITTVGKPIITGVILPIEKRTFWSLLFDFSLLGNSNKTKQGHWNLMKDEWGRN